MRNIRKWVWTITLFVTYLISASNMDDINLAYIGYIIIVVGLGIIWNLPKTKN